MKQANCPSDPTPSSRRRPASLMRGGLLLASAAWLTGAALAQEDAAPKPAAAAPPVKVDSNALSRSGAGGVTSFAPIVDKLAPSVVTVYTSKTVRRDLRSRGGGAQGDMLRRFFGGQLAPEGEEGGGAGGPRSEKMQGLGSGVIVSPDGQILTNNHVIEGADEILVRVGPSAKEYKAIKVGADPSTDLAVLKINAKDLPAATFADSDKARIGDLVLAIGNPFGLGQTVTMGIISATGRGGMDITDYENFIQTDASINPGNSGGPLIDAEGRVLGINTAIFSRSGGNQGIGFAVPSNLARQVFQSLHEKGRVIRGYLGTVIQPLTPDLVKLFKLPEDAAGALVSQVEPNGPADKAGLKEGDLITAVDGKKMADPRQLRLAISELAPAAKVTLTVVREGKEREVSALLGELTASKLRQSRSNNGGGGDDNSNEQSVGKSNILDGITVGNLDDKARADLKLPAKMQGALITAVDPDCAGYQAGLRQGDVVLEVNREPVKDADEAVTLSDKVEKEESVLLRVYTKGGSRYVALAPKAP